MEKKLPYYMAYPMPLQFDDEKRDRMDFEYMKSMYPKMAKQLLPYIEEECDRMEFAGSMIFDEYPDQLQLRMMGKRVYDQISRDGILPESEEEIPGGGVGGDAVIRDLIQVMLNQEIYKRRSDHRRYNRRFYPGTVLK